MTDLERLTNTLDALKVFYSVTGSDSHTSVHVSEPEDNKDQYIPYIGYDGFYYTFIFDSDGCISNVAGME